MVKLRSYIIFFLVLYAAFGGAVINQLHNHQFHACESGHAEQSTPCPVSIFFANIAGETSGPVDLDSGDLVIQFIADVAVCADYRFEVDGEPSRAPPIA